MFIKIVEVISAFSVCLWVMLWEHGYFRSIGEVPMVFLFHILSCVARSGPTLVSVFIYFHPALFLVMT